MVKMVKDITGFGRNGMSDWLVQRVSAIIMLIYVIILAGLFFAHPHLDYIQWRSFFEATWLRFATLLFMLSLVAHAWIGMWTIGTDYITCPKLRLSYQLLVIFALAACLFYGVHILWGN